MLTPRQIRVGTSGWAYKHWRGDFYPAAVKVKSQLQYLSSLLNSVEVNGTFYSLTRPTSCDLWRSHVPDDFVFTVKGSRYITHMCKLQNIEAALGNFFASGILRLGSQLGPILWQLPAMLHFDANRAEVFFSQLPKTISDAERVALHHDERVAQRMCLRAPDGRERQMRHALEVRHESWLCDEATSILEKHKVALVTADTAGRFPYTVQRTSDFVYIRLHGASELYRSGYTADEIATWSGRIKQWARQSDVYVYFDNDALVHAPKDAIALLTSVQRQP